MIVIDEAANRLLEVLTMPRLQELAWTKHGFRGPLGSISGPTHDAITGLLPADIDAILAMPDASVMLGLMDLLKN